MLLRDRVAVVTGGASERGIGRAIAALFAEHGARVAILDYDGAGAEEAAGAIRSGTGVKAAGYRCDVTSREEVREAVSRVAGELGPPTVLANNAGITQPKKIDQISEADYDAVLDVNLRGTLLMVQAMLPHMRRAGGGSIVCMSSVSAKRGGGVFGGPHYSAAKAGVLGLARALARDLAPEGIRVNAVCPGFIDTDITKGQLSQERRRDIEEAIPLGRAGSAREVAQAFLFLAGPMSSYVTGEVLDVNGGSHID